MPHSVCPRPAPRTCIRTRSLHDALPILISEYRVLSSAGEGIDYQGKVLLNSRAVRLLSYVEDMSGDEKVRTIQSKELWLAEDRKSTRLNSSHVSTSYAVFCLKKKTGTWT